MSEAFVMNSPVGKLYIETEGEYLIGLEYHSKRALTTGPVSKTAKKVKKQIEAYFSSADHNFELPIKLNGTDFQKKVWAAMRKIPAGKACTYGEISDALKSSPRAVGNACRANPIPLVVPCHRIVAKSGIGGFGGQTKGRNINCKTWLLKHEGFYSE